MSLFKKVAVNTLSNYLLRLLQIALSLVAVPVFIASIGKEGLGLITLANAILGYFVLVDIGIPTGVTKYVAEFATKKDSPMVGAIINTSLGLFCGIGAFVLVGVVLFEYAGGLRLFNIAPASMESARMLLYIAGVFSLLSWPRKVLEGAFKGLQQFHKVNAVLGVGRVLGVAAAIIVARAGHSVEAVFFAMNLEIALTTIALYAWLRREVPSWRFRPSQIQWPVFKMLFAFSGWLFLSQLAALLEYNSDVIILGAFLPVSMIAVYSVLMNPFRMIQQASGLAASAVMPAVSERQATHGKQGVDTFIYRGVKYHNVLFAPWAIVGAFLCQPFIRLWVGPDFLGHVWVAQLACVFQLIWQSNAMLGQVYLGTGRARKLSLLAMVIGFSNVVTSLILVHVIGLPGVILGTVGIGAISVPVTLFLLLPDLQTPIRRYVKDVLIRAQLPYWVLGVMMLPLWTWCQQIHTWETLIATACLMCLVFYSAGWFLGLDRNIRQRILFAVGRPAGARS